jgi:hypothetical protein
VSDSASDAEVEFLGVKSDGSAEAPAAASPWECALCTFLNEDVRARRCEMCDSARADVDAPPKKKTRMMSQWLAQPAARRTPVKADREKMEPVESSDGDGDIILPSRSLPGRSARRKTSEGGGALTAPAQLWAEAHAPNAVSDLCVNKKKIEELREWIARSATCDAVDCQHPPRQRLLFLCGPPGAGKSTAVRCIAQELDLTVAEWGDNESAGRLHYDRMFSSEFQTPYVSSLNDFADFIRQSVSYSALPLVTVSRRRARGGKAEPTAEESSHVHRKRKFPGGVGGAEVATSMSPLPTGHIILLESWPETWSRDQKTASEEKLQQIFRQIVDSGARYRGFPVVCIYSDVRESKVAVDQLGRKFSVDVVRSPYTAVMNINPVTTGTTASEIALEGTDGLIGNCCCMLCSDAEEAIVTCGRTGKVQNLSKRYRRHRRSCQR